MPGSPAEQDRVRGPPATAAAARLAATPGASSVGRPRPTNGYAVVVEVDRDGTRAPAAERVAPGRRRVRPARVAPVELRLLQQHHLLQPLEGGDGVDAQLLGQVPP